MAKGGSGLAKAAIAAAALVVGGAVGALAARAAMRTDPPPPPVFVNPMADAKPGETLALKRNDGTISNYRVLEADPLTLLLLEEIQPPGEPSASRRLRVSRSWTGGFLVLEGDVDPAAAAAAIRDLVVERVEPDTIVVETLGRPVPCWKFTCRHRVLGRIVSWVSDELPVHGLVRVDTEKAERTFVLHGFHEAK
jgi:hypothetical protein